MNTLINIINAKVSEFMCLCVCLLLSHVKRAEGITKKFETNRPPVFGDCGLE